MVEAYYHDDNDLVDFREAHNGGEAVTLEQLGKLGVIYKFLNTQDKVDSLAKERNYKNRDTVNISLSSFENNENALLAKLNVFYKEHLHEDEEIRYILDGEGYFDIRDSILNKWIRVKVESGDLLIVPAGIYHRFTLTTSNYIKAMRLFQDEPKWLAINRPEADENATHKEYLSALLSIN